MGAELLVLAGFLAALVIGLAMLALAARAALRWRRAQDGQQGSAPPAQESHAMHNDPTEPDPTASGADATAGTHAPAAALAAEPDASETAQARNGGSDSSNATNYPLLASPHVLLSGTVDQNMYINFRNQLANAPKEGTLVMAISTLGGDPEVARLMGDEVRLMREYTGREILFLGKVAVYSAGATFMAAFPVDKRFLTKGTRLMIHERLMTSTINLSGPLKTLTATLKAKLHEIEHSILIEEEGFRDLVAGSKVDFDEVRRRAPENWYIDAEEARDKGLVLDVI